MAGDEEKDQNKNSGHRKHKGVVAASEYGHSPMTNLEAHFFNQLRILENQEFI